MRCRNRRVAERGGFWFPTLGFRYPPSLRGLAGLMIAVAGLILSRAELTARADDAAQPAGASGEAVLQAQLQAGEFAPALDSARHAATPQQRNAWLAQIAVAQADAGSRDAALRSAAEIDDDVARGQALSSIAKQPAGAAGGGSEPDFDSLIDLITSTVKPTSWDTVGGPGSVAPFPTGVYVDSQGILRNTLKEEATGRLGQLRGAGSRRVAGDDVRRSSPLRMVSLPRLERQVQLLLAAGRRPSEAMQVLAGLQRIEYVFVYPESGDLVIAGPAGDWTAAASGRVVSSDAGRPVLRLDDLVVILRHMRDSADGRFGCLIVPTQDALARVQQFLAQSRSHPLKPENRGAWLEELRGQLGQQDIEVSGLDPRTHAAHVMVEADYRMKLVAMGLEKGVPGVASYLASLKVPPGQAPPPMSVLRWWFTINYDAVLASADHQAFALRGQGVKVLSENERLTAQGRRIHPGTSDELTRQFAESFTQHFEELAAEYPIYGELRNLFDLALVGALIRQDDLAGRTAWHMACFGDPAAYQVELAPAPKKVDTVMNYRVINREYVVAGVTGGVVADVAPLVAPAKLETDAHNRLTAGRAAATPTAPPADVWWWDVAK